MLVCGIETPIGQNEFLPIVDDKSQELDYGKMQNVRLNRYSFLSISEVRIKTEDCSQIINTMNNDSNNQWYRIAAWRHPITDEYKFQAKVRLARFVREGWHTQIENKWGFAVCQMDTQESMLHSPNIAAWSLSWCVIFGKGLSTKEIIESQPLKTSIVSGGGLQQLYPSLSLLQWMSEKQLTLIYTKRDDAGRIGLVIIEPCILSINHLIHKGMFDKIYRGTDSKFIWRYSPYHLCNQSQK